jgi:hypothetical protein
MRGFGTGVIFATVILMIAFAIHSNMPSNQKSNVNSSGNVDILSGLKDESATTTSYNEQGADKTSNNETQEETSLSDKTSNNETQEETSLSDKTSNNETQEETSSSDKDLDDTTIKDTMTSLGENDLLEGNDEYVAVKITSGMYSTDAAALLEKCGLVESAEEFNTYLCDYGYESKLKIGEYQIKKGSTYREIAKIITR